MKTNNLIPKLFATGYLAATITLLAFSNIAQAKKGDLEDTPVKTTEIGSIFETSSSWSIAYENDVFVPGSRDQDYTFGLNITFAGAESENHWASLHNTVDWLNQSMGLDHFIEPGIEASRIEYGVFGFTPEDISLSSANPDDRPYSSLIYASSVRENYDRLNQVSWHSTLTVGVLGLNLPGEIQGELHSAIDSQQPDGWDNQISQGGEPTLRYSLSRQQLLSETGDNSQLKSTIQGSVGYITEVSWSLSVRAGKIHTPWISFNPELATYGEKSSPNDFVRVSEQYIWAGISLKLRAYNALLEGQFLDSDVTYDSNEINRGIVEAWVGYTLALEDGYSFTYSIRGHTSELNRGDADRNVIWGGVLITKSFT